MSENFYSSHLQLMADLPLELHLEILEYLDHNTVLNVRLVCKSLAKLAARLAFDSFAIFPFSSSRDNLLQLAASPHRRHVKTLRVFATALKLDTSLMHRHALGQEPAELLQLHDDLLTEQVGALRPLAASPYTTALQRLCRLTAIEFKLLDKTPRAEQGCRGALQLLMVDLQVPTYPSLIFVRIVMAAVCRRGALTTVSPLDSLTVDLLDPTLRRQCYAEVFDGPTGLQVPRYTLADLGRAFRSLSAVSLSSLAIGNTENLRISTMLTYTVVVRTLVLEGDGRAQAADPALMRCLGQALMPHLREVVISMPVDGRILITFLQSHTELQDLDVSHCQCREFPSIFQATRNHPELTLLSFMHIRDVSYTATNDVVTSSLYFPNGLSQVQADWLHGGSGPMPDMLS